MLGIIEPSILERLIDAILKQDEEIILDFISNADEFEAEMVIDELMFYLKDILLSNSKKIRPIIVDKFFKALTDAKRLLNIGSNGEFVLSLTLLKMMDSLKVNNRVENGKNIEPVQQLESKPKTTKIADMGLDKFTKLISKIYDRNHKLGQCFEKNIQYVSYSDNTLIWESKAIGEEKKLLKNQWGKIRMFAQEIFGFDIKIKNLSKVPKKIAKDSSRNSATQKREIDILKEPIVVKAKELFQPKKVIIRSKKLSQ
jgi:DNA polymerase-3 subunit gamma/tau